MKMNNNFLQPNCIDNEYFSSPIVITDYSFLSDPNMPHQDMYWPYYNDYSLDTQLSYQDNQIAYCEPPLPYCEPSIVYCEPAITYCEQIPMSMHLAPMISPMMSPMMNNQHLYVPQPIEVKKDERVKHLELPKIIEPISKEIKIKDDKGKLQYQCEICKKSFERKYVLKRHVGSHFNIKTHHCKPCNISFYRKDIYDRHRTTKKCIKAHQLLPIHTTHRAHISNMNSTFSNNF